MSNIETPTVRVGQVWADNDKRGTGRNVRVVEIVGRYAHVEQVSSRRGWSDKPGRRTRIRLDRFKPTTTGYRLVQDVSVSAA